jgi:hypothetical protein
MHTNLLYTRDEVHESYQLMVVPRITHSLSSWEDYYLGGRLAGNCPPVAQNATSPTLGSSMD